MEQRVCQINLFGRYPWLTQSAMSSAIFQQQTHFKGVTLHLSARMIVWLPAPAEIE
jgi:hypothetical protein